MSSYKGHCTFNLFMGLPVLMALFYYFLQPKPIFLYVFIGMYAYTTFFMNPDLDLVHKIKITSIRGFFSLPFRAYSSIFKHRGISHSFFFGSLTRIFWLTGLGFLIFFLIYQTLPASSNFGYFWKNYKYFILYGFAGICLADWCHLILDLKIKK